MRRRALSLIEVVLSLVILGLAVPPLMIQLGGAVRAHGDDAVYLNMSQLASERIGEIFADRADATRGYAYIVAANYPAETAPHGLNGYTRITKVREVSPADHVSPLADSGIKRIRVVIRGPGDKRTAVETFVVWDVAGAATPEESSGDDAATDPSTDGYWRDWYDRVRDWRSDDRWRGGRRGSWGGR